MVYLNYASFSFHFFLLFSYFIPPFLIIRHIKKIRFLLLCTGTGYKLYIEKLKHSF
ncbi:hypothetical protein PARMER_02384 [Parabacteroides merdae ATCC 43184]|nr:hypothetical protein PARMER_02384 [Parabacteroides merdae ATCC 43184]